VESFSRSDRGTDPAHPPLCPSPPNRAISFQPPSDGAVPAPASHASCRKPLRSTGLFGFSFTRSPWRNGEAEALLSSSSATLCHQPGSRHGAALGRSPLMLPSVLQRLPRLGNSSQSTLPSQQVQSVVCESEKQVKCQSKPAAHSELHLEWKKGSVV